MNAKRGISDDVKSIVKKIFQTWTIMTTGDQLTTESEYFYELSLGIILVFLANILLLNLIVAIMGDSYEEVMTSVAEKNLRQ